MDGCFNPGERSGGCGFIIRDSVGDAVGDPLQAEAETCCAAIQFGQEWGMSRIIIETDAQELVRALTSEVYDLSSNGVLFREIKAFAALNFSVFSVVDTPRISFNFMPGCLGEL